VIETIPKTAFFVANFAFQIRGPINLGVSGCWYSPEPVDVGLSWLRLCPMSSFRFDDKPTGMVHPNHISSKPKAALLVG
jgi:hypothetical protein